jgi:hypothetical protein
MHGISHFEALALVQAMVSSMLGGLPLQVDAIPNENVYIRHGKSFLNH